MNDRVYNGIELIDWNGTQIPFNEIVDFENEFFRGKVLFMIKTRPEDPRYAAHFAKKQRKFEMQIQGHFKKLPDGVLYMGAELTEKMQLGLVTKSVAGMVLSFGKRLIKNLHYSFGEAMKGVDDADEIELPHVTFPLSRGMDRLVVTEPGGTPPKLGDEIHEPEDLRAARKGGKGEELQFALNKMYTMSFYSMYIDFINWQLVNIAGLKSVDLANYCGDSAVHIVVYDLNPSVANSANKHRKVDKRYFFHCELVNTNLCPDEGDKGELGAAEAGEAGKEPDERDVSGSVFIRSGDVIPLMASSEGPNSGWACVCESKGYCVLRPPVNGVAPIEVEILKVGGTSAYYRSDFLTNGDVVILRSVQSGKYLSLYKGWWLWWTSTPPSSSSNSRAHFVIGGLHEAERLTAGRAFTLRSGKWSTYQVGAAESPTSEHGGRPIGLLQTSKVKKMFQSRKSKTWLQPLYIKVQSAKDAAEAANQQMATVGMAMGGDLAQSGGNGSPPRGDKDEDDRVDASLGSFLEHELAITPEEVEEELEVDVPAWIELVHRRKRKPQLAYVLRLRFKHKPEVTWIALRTGVDLAPVIQMQRERAADGAGMNHKEDITSTSSQYKLQRGPHHHKGSTASKRISDAIAPPSSPNPGPLQRGPHHHKGSTASKRISDAIAPPSSPNPGPLQHQSPADQSVRLLAQLLLDITSSRTPEGDHTRTPPSCKAALFSVLRKPTHLDHWWLSGVQPSDIGVSLPSKSSIIFQSNTCRALWDTHWKEEWMALYPSHISFFSPGSKKPTWSLLLHDILSAKSVTASPRLPFVSKHFLSIETLGRVHYVCFLTEAVRDAWLVQIQSRISQASTDIPSGLLVNDPREAFILKSGQWRPSSRLVLNSRRMSFDVSPSALQGTTPSQLSEHALRMVYALSPESTTDRLIAFLDLCSLFKAIPLHTLDLSSDEAAAFFLNTYHTLVQHALLLLGPPSSKHWANFFQSVSYEIGSDVFSLNEMEHCVLRGRLSRPRSVSRHLSSPPHSDDDHYRYAVSGVDYRVNFALINGSVSGPPFITVFRADNLSPQLDNACVRYIDYALKLDSKKRAILLPKVCDTYRADFAGMDVVKVCMRYLDRHKWERLSWAQAHVKPPAIKYMSLKPKCHDALNLIEDREAAAAGGPSTP